MLYTPSFSIFTVLFPGHTVCPAGFNPSGMYCYHVKQQSGSFSSQDTYCQSRGGYLAKVDTARENVEMKKAVAGKTWALLDMSKERTCQSQIFPG